MIAQTDRLQFEIRRVKWRAPWDSRARGRNARRTLTWRTSHDCYHPASPSPLASPNSKISSNLWPSRLLRISNPPGNPSRPPKGSLKRDPPSLPARELARTARTGGERVRRRGAPHCAACEEKCAAGGGGQFSGDWSEI